MSCSNCSSGGGTPRGCKNNGNCSSGGCNKLEVFDWLANVALPSGQSPYDIVEVRFKNSRKSFYRNAKGFSLHVGDVIVVDHESYFICLAVGWMPVSEKVYNFWIEHDLQDRKMHPLIWSKSPIETLINIANMEEGFLFRK